jgi:hypothetical protein
MDQNRSERCPHFQIYSEPLDLGGEHSHLAIYRCLLTERMISLVRSRSEGVQMATKLVVNVTNGKEFAFAGPDLEAVTQLSCMVSRCDEHCTPAYVRHLDHFQIVDPHLDSVTCHEADDGDKQDQSGPQPCAHS